MTLDAMQKAARAGGPRQAPEWLGAAIEAIEKVLADLETKAAVSWDGPLPLDSAIGYLQGISGMQKHLQAARRNGEEAAMWLTEGKK